MVQALVQFEEIRDFSCPSLQCFAAAPRDAPFFRKITFAALMVISFTNVIDRYAVKGMPF